MTDDTLAETVRRLRDWRESFRGNLSTTWCVCLIDEAIAAAEESERLREENEQLKAQLSWRSQLTKDRDGHDPSCELMQPVQTEPIEKSAAFPHGGRKLAEDKPWHQWKCTCGVAVLRERLARVQACVPGLLNLQAWIRQEGMGASSLDKVLSLLTDAPSAQEQAIDGAKGGGQ